MMKLKDINKHPNSGNGVKRVAFSNETETIPNDPNEHIYATMEGSTGNKKRRTSALKYSDIYFNPSHRYETM